MAVLQNNAVGAEGFRNSLAEGIREQAELAENSGDTQVVQSRARTLRLLADYVLSLEPNDQRLAILCEAERERSTSDSRWTPRGKVGQVIAYAGSDPNKPPTSADLLEELARYAASDSRTAIREQLVGSFTATAQQERESARAAIEAEVTRAQDSEEKLRGERNQAQTKLLEVSRDRDYWKALAEGKKAATKAKATA